LSAASFDLICSYASFEHVENPEAALAELLRLCKTGGYVYLEFSPLWCSPLGLHALKFNMPYPQFLFSNELIEVKIRQFPNVTHAVAQEGEWTVGKKHADLMNKCRIGYFRALWQQSGAEIISLNESTNFAHLNIIANFPLAFTGRGLNLEDVTTDGVSVLLKKR
jgi:SAM-dependent methyltransferase